MLYLDILYHTFLLLSILGGLFIFWGKNKEKEIVNTMIIRLIRKHVKNIKLSDDTKYKLLKTGVPSQCFEKRNLSLFLIFLSFFIVFLMVVVIVTLIAFKTYSSNEIWIVITKNILIFICILIFQVFFFELVVLKYIPITEYEVHEIVKNVVKSEI